MSARTPKPIATAPETVVPEVLPPEGSEVTTPSASAGVVVMTEFATARNYLQAAELSSQLGAALAIFAGLELLRLHKTYGVTRGRPKKDAANNSEPQFRIKWEDLVKEQLGISREYADRLMKLAETSKGRVKELEAADILSVPLLSMPAERQAQLKAAVSALVDDKTARQLMFEWGVMKDSTKPGTNNPAGPGPSTAAPKGLDQDAQEAVATWLLPLGTFNDHMKMEAYLRVLPLDPDHQTGRTINLHEVHAQLSKALDIVKDARTKAMKQAREKQTPELRGLQEEEERTTV